MKWIEHSWGIKDGNLIETTGLFFEDYKGKALKKGQSRRFVFNELAFSDFPEDREVYETWLISL